VMMAVLGGAAVAQGPTEFKGHTGFV